MSKRDALAKTESALVIPDYLKGQTQKGLEQVDREDLILPRLAIAQSGSPAFKKASKTRIEGLEEGELFNTLTRRIYGDKVDLVPVLLLKSAIKFKPKGDDGSVGGIAGMTNDLSRIPPADLEFGPDGQKPIWTKFYNFISWIPDLKEMVSVSLKSSDTKAAKTWISFMRLAGLPAYAKVYRVSTVPVSKGGYDFFGFEIQPTGAFTPEAIYHEADKLYASLSGRALKIDVEGLAAEEQNEEHTPF